MKKTQPTTAQEPVTEQSTDENLQKIAELVNDLQRTRADFENFRKQIEMQKEHEKTATKLATILKFLPLIDDMERAISSYSELKPLEKTLVKTLSNLGLQKINSDTDAPFNPDFHDAISMEDNEGTQEVIAETLLPGYLYENEVIRPAMVKVKKIIAPNSK